MLPRPQTLPSPPTPAFTGGTLDRAAKLRASSSRVDGLIADPAARAVFSRGDAVLVSTDGSQLVRAPLPQTTLAGRPDGRPAPLLLGLEADGPLFGIDLDWLDEAGSERVSVAGRLNSLRDAGMLLPAPEAGLAAYLVALTAWHRHHRFCANCGAPTDLVEAGLSRHCPSCGRSHFPRTDPVVIMVVQHDDRLLLGRRPVWPAGRYSLLAGFVAPGETPEEAVVREVREESGIEAQAPRYVTSQPWPFPASLMLGFIASSPGGEPYCADGELQDVRWFSREEVQVACAEGSDWTDSEEESSPWLLLPPPVSIARSLIDWWLQLASGSEPGRVPGWGRP
jgi:NAD+ diphosphatase